MENQHRQISGYRELNQEEIDLMNNIKELASAVGVLVSGWEENPLLDQRWVAIAKTDLQKGFMAAIRSVAQPTTF